MTASPSQLPRCTPETQGISSTALLRLLNAWETQSLELHSFMLLRQGHILAEGWWKPYRAETPHKLFSLTKSFVATAIGFALDEGHLTLDDPVLTFFPEYAPTHPSKHLRAMQIHHLLSMTTGHAADPEKTTASNKTIDFLSAPVEYAPGTHFVYNNGASQMLAAIVQNVTGQRVQDYLATRLFTPLGIGEVVWDVGYQDIEDGARGLRLTTEAIARFGLFYLQQGVWNGNPLLSPEWVQQATSCQTIFPDASPDSEETFGCQGYGFQFWCGRQGMSIGAGSFGQYCVILPQHQIVVAITAGVQDESPVLKLLAEHLFSELTASSLPEDIHAHAALKKQLTSLELRRLEGAATSPLAARISSRSFLLVPNSLGYTRIRFDFATAFCRIHITNERGPHLLASCIDGEWQKMRTRLNADKAEEIAVQSVWTSADTFTFRCCSLETPYCTTITCRFDLPLLRLHYQRNVGVPAVYDILGWCKDPR